MTATCRLLTMLFAALLLMNAFGQDPPSQDIPEAFQGTPRGYTIQGGDREVTTYTAVRTFFEMLGNRISLLDSRADPRPLALFTARFEIPEGTRAWDALMDAYRSSKPILSRRLPVEELAARSGDELEFEQLQLDFTREVVLHLRREYLRLVAELRDCGVEIAQFERFIKQEATRHVKVSSDAPYDDPSVQRMLAVERLFDQQAQKEK